MAEDKQLDPMTDPEFQKQLAELGAKSSPRINWKKIKKGVYRFKTHEEADEWWRRVEEPVNPPRCESGT